MEEESKVVDTVSEIIGDFTKVKIEKLDQYLEKNFQHLSTKTKSN
jgi:hypothetical protein